MASVKTHQLDGGYKAYRYQALASYKIPLRLQVIGGYTGSGKSEILRALRDRGEQVLDLEALASHKGSVFGGLTMSSQPTTEQFQNDLYEELIRLNPSRRIWVEDESIAIGKIFLPQDFWQQMSDAPLHEVTVEKPIRVERLVREYGHANKQEFLTAMKSITKRLGGQNFKAAQEKLLEGDMAGTIDILLTYYDKAYQTGLFNKKHRTQTRATWNGKDPVSVVDQLIAGTPL